jgi:hypothetical protein
MASAKFNTKSIEGKFKQYKKLAQKRVPPVLKSEIVSEIKKGRSPVKGQGRLVGYSDSYLKAIASGRYTNFGKQKRPVNMTLSGKMLKSIFTRFTKRGIEVGFDDPLADIHNSQGAGKSKVIRRLLPTEKGEKFKSSITLRIREVLTNVMKDVLK